MAIKWPLRFDDEPPQPTATDILRDELERRGIRYECGLTYSDGSRTELERYTCIYPTSRGIDSLTFEEDDGRLYSVDGMSPAQCIAAALARKD